MLRKMVAVMFGLSVASLAGAVVDPDSVGRSVKFLDSSLSQNISLFSPASSCMTLTGTPPPDVRCIKMSGNDNEKNDVPDVGRIDVAANGAKSKLIFSMNPLVLYSLSNSGTARKNSSIFTYVKATIESPVFNNPSLINPRTGMPLGGKVEVSTNWFGQSRSFEPNQNEDIMSRLPFEMTILTKQTLINVYGLSPALATAVFSQPIAVRISVSTISTGMSRATFFMTGRLYGD